MSQRVLAVLEEIDTILSTGLDGASQLWDILSALRGPDEGTFAASVKARVTVHIRAAAFPKTAESPQTVPADFVVTKRWAPNRARDISAHFQYHADAAATALRQLGRKVG